jgi:multiple sugar transport system permease protein
MAASAGAPQASPVAGLTGARRATPATRAARAVRYAVFYICLTLIAIVFVAPYLIAFFAAFKSESAVYGTAPWSPPHSAYTQNFTTVLFTDGFARFLENTALVTAVLTIGQVAFGVLAAYAFARLEFPGREVLFSVYLATLMVPNVVTLVPLYTIMRQAHLIDTYWALFLPYVLGSPYTIFLMRQYFRSLPSDVFAAARVDGASEWRILTRILLPMGWPIIITATLIAFVFGWNNFLWPLIVIDSPGKQVLTVGLAALQSYYIQHWNLVLAASVVALAPLLAIFAVFQKQIVKSIQLSGVNR